MACDVSILILSWNTQNLLRECLDSIPRGAAGLETETIVVDNASSDGSADMVADAFPWARLVRNDENAGFARGNNQAYALASGDYILLLNSDVVLPEGSVEEMVRPLQADASVGMVVPKLVYPDGTVQSEMYGHLPTLNSLVRAWTRLHRLLPRGHRGADPPPVDLSREGVLDFAPASCVMLRRAMIEQLDGLFDERFPLLHNDVDLCRRVRDVGWTILYRPEIAVLHYKSQSIRKMPATWKVEHVVTAMRYLAKHDGFARAALFWLAIAVDSLLLVPSRLRLRILRRPVPVGLREELQWRGAALCLGRWRPEGTT